MNCAEAKRYLALTREGELTGEEERNLRAHVRSCSACAAEREAFERQNRAIGKLRSITPELPDPEANVQAVLAHVRTDAPLRRQRRGRSLIDRMGGFLEIPGLRYALAALVTVIVTGFIVQQISVLRSVSALESRLSRPEAPRIRLAYTLSPEGIEQLRRSEEVRAILQAQGTGRSHNLEKLGGEHAGTIAALIDSPESRQVLRALVPAAGGPAMENLLKILSLNARLVLTYSKGEVPQ